MINLADEMRKQLKTTLYCKLIQNCNTDLWKIEYCTDEDTEDTYIKVIFNQEKRDKYAIMYFDSYIKALAIKITKDRATIFCEDDIDLIVFIPDSYINIQETTDGDDFIVIEITSEKLPSFLQARSLRFDSFPIFEYDIKNNGDDYVGNLKAYLSPGMPDPISILSNVSAKSSKRIALKFIEFEEDVIHHDIGFFELGYVIYKDDNGNMIIGIIEKFNKTKAVILPLTGPNANKPISVDYTWLLTYENLTVADKNCIILKSSGKNMVDFVNKDFISYNVESWVIKYFIDFYKYLPDTEFINKQIANALDIIKQEPNEDEDEKSYINTMNDVNNSLKDTCVDLSRSLKIFSEIEKSYEHIDFLMVDGLDIRRYNKNTISAFSQMMSAMMDLIHSFDEILDEKDTDTKGIKMKMEESEFAHEDAINETASTEE